MMFQQSGDGWCPSLNDYEQTLRRKAFTYWSIKYDDVMLRLLFDRKLGSEMKNGSLNQNCFHKDRFVDQFTSLFLSI